jgi:ABC-type uncharacterized transport system ATPase subunit
MPEPATLIDSLRKSNGDMLTADSLSLDIDYGKLFGLPGHNGAGKYESINMLAARL